MKKLLIALAVVTMIVVSTASAGAATTDTVEVTATPEFISISVTPIDYDYEGVAESSTESTITTYFAVDNTSSVITDVEIYVTGDWTGGVGWTHSDTATPGADTAGMKANKGGTWETGDVIVKKTSAYELIADDQAADTDFDFGLKLYAPTSFGDGVEKANTVTLSSAAAA